MTTALVLTAGGARGAYQAGVLKRISEIPRFRKGAAPFQIITGTSAGAINGAALAATYSDFAKGADRLAWLWAQLRPQDVFRTDVLAFGRIGAKLAHDLLIGPIRGSVYLHGLVDPTPLRAYLQRQLPMERIQESVKAGLDAIAITATGYHSGRTFTFVEGRDGHRLWNKSRRVALRARLGVDHVLASAAIPLVFPPVCLTMENGTRAYFGDGALRGNAPFSPAIRLGAKRLLAVGIRCHEAANSLLRSETTNSVGLVAELQNPPFAQICGVFMNTIFLDHLDADLEHLQRVNALVESKAISSGSENQNVEPMDVVRPLVVSPSADIALIAATLQHRLPRALRFALDGLGKPDARSADLTSFLLFDNVYASELIQLGYRDAAQRIDEIEDFLMQPAC